MTRSVQELVAAVLDRIDLERVWTTLTEIAELDRYQASLGIQQAARRVAKRANAAGLSELSIEQFAADGRSWWTFAGPVSWTPIEGRLEAYLDADRVVAVDHASSPCTLATHSAPTPASGIVAPLAGAEAGAGTVAVIAGAEMNFLELVPRLEAAGALGFITDATCRTVRGDTFPGRVELPPGSPLFAFSVQPEDLRSLLRLRERAGAAHVRVQIDKSASMPVVTGLLPGEAAGNEIWLIAHLCHPRPGANDNASGVAATLGIADTLRRAPDLAPVPMRPIRFVWGPEFTGPAALLHHRANRNGSVDRPAFVLNFDMVAADPLRLGGPFVVEHDLDLRTSILGPLAAFVMEEVFRQTSDAPGTWGTAPFLGASDHAVFASPFIASPVVHFCHPDDPFNHSAGDATERIDPTELRRAVALGTTLTLLLSGDHLPEADRRAVVDRWCRREATTQPGPWPDAHSRSGRPWQDGMKAYARRRQDTLRRWATTTPARGTRAAWRSRDSRNGAAPAAWSGPINLRALLQAASPSTRKEALRCINDDKTNLAVLFHLAAASHEPLTPANLDDASYASRHPLDERTARALVAVLDEAGWSTPRRQDDA